MVYLAHDQESGTNDGGDMCYYGFCNVAGVGVGGFLGSFDRAAEYVQNQKYLLDLFVVFDTLCLDRQALAHYLSYCSTDIKIEMLLLL